MKIFFHPDILDQQVYRCNCCGQGCRSFLVPLDTRERESIEKLDNWQEKLGEIDLFVRSRAAGKSGCGLAKHPDGRCVFLDNDNLCLIHKLHGLKAKPLACQLYPFVVTPFAGELRVGLRFDCPAVCDSTGHSLCDYQQELRRLISQIVPPGAENAEPPPVLSRQKISAKHFDQVNEVFLKIINSDSLPLLQRLHWLRLFGDHISRIKWQNVTDEDLPELLKMLQGGLLAEVQRRKVNVRPVKGKPRKLLGQIFSILSHPTTIITSQKKGIGTVLKKRLNILSMMKQISRNSDPLPKIQPHWPDCDISLLEKSFGPWPPEVEQMLTRYLTCRIAALGYCGPNFYNFSMIEGLHTMLLAIVTIGFLMRIEAVGHKRTHIELADAHKAVMTIDGNLGYASALGTAPMRLTLSQLTDHIESLLDWYCS
ncbi:MAG: YkgJ family cysteine cluster protein [Sedimentisphaerales bacterium]|nr:YkgJ family cysteine cluster protein [Sedimentisphaerales bacterium]